MKKLIRKKVILCLLDSDPKSAGAIANEIDESVTTVDSHLTELVSDSICEEITQDEGCQYTIRKDVDAFAQSVKEFLLNPAEHEQEIEQFITSEHYHTRIDDELVDYVLRRFHLKSVYQAGEDKERIRRILLVSPSSLFFALHEGTESFRESWAHWNRLDSPNKTRDWFVQSLCSAFETPLSERLIADRHISPYRILYTKLQIKAERINIQIGLATVDEKYVEVIGGGNYAFYKMADGVRPRNGALVSLVNPIGSSDVGIAFSHLGEYQTALDSFNHALERVEDPSQRAIVLNNMGWTFLQLKQYQKAIGCFEEGIALDSDGGTPELRVNKQIAEEYLARATDADNLTAPTQIRFVQNIPIPFEETLFYEFKEIGGGNPASRIGEIVDEYAVGFLNCEGGRIFWGIRDKDRITVGVRLNHRVRNEIRENVPNKLNSIQPSISPEHCKLEFHEVYDLQGETVEDLWVIELVVPRPQERDVFYTSSPKLYVRDDGVTRELKGPAATEFILRRMQSDTETN